MKKLPKNLPTNAWRYILSIIVFFLVYQLLFSSNGTPQSVSQPDVIKPEETLFITIEENRFSIRKATFNSLIEKLEIWRFDEDQKKIFIKFESLFPTASTKAMVVYNKRSSKFEKHEEIFSVNSFPYTYSFQNTPFVTFSGADKDETAYLEFDGKNIQLGKNQIYYHWSIDGYQLVRTKVKNYGFYDKSSFVSFPKSK